MRKIPGFRASQAPAPLPYRPGYACSPELVPSFSPAWHQSLSPITKVACGVFLQDSGVDGGDAAVRSGGPGHLLGPTLGSTTSRLSDKVLQFNCPVTYRPVSSAPTDTFPRTTPSQRHRGLKKEQRVAPVWKEGTAGDLCAADTPPTGHRCVQHPADEVLGVNGLFTSEETPLLL